MKLKNKKFISFLLCVILLAIYIFFLFNLTYNNLNVNNLTKNTDYYTLYNNESDDIKKIIKTKSFSNIATNIIKNAYSNMYFKTEKLNLSDILDMVDSSYDQIIKESNINYTKELNRTLIFAASNKLYQGTSTFINNGNPKIINVFSIIFSKVFTNIILVIFSINILALIILNNKFIWLKINSYILIVSSISTFLSIKIISYILNLNNLISTDFTIRFIHSVIKTIGVYSNKYCLLYMLMGIICLIVYIISKQALNNNKTN